MKKQKLFALLLCIALLIQLFTVYALADEVEDIADAADVDEDSGDTLPEEDVSPLTLELACKGAILIELNSDTTVFEQNADERLYPASLTKIMTCLLALERGVLSDEVKVDTALMQGMDADASIVGLEDGEVLTLEELLYCVMVPSANDASLVVADHIAGSVEAFVELMNQRAKELGCTNTHFVNPDGLHDEEHYTTARDMAIITKAALKLEAFRTLCGTAVHEIPETNLSSSRIIYTTNYFMDTTITPKYYWEKVSGIKTGFTTPAGRCLACLVEEGDFSYLSIVLGCETPYDENGEAVLGSFPESRRLMEYGLENFTFVCVLSHLNPIAQVPVSSGAVKSVVIAPAQDVSALLPAAYDPAKLNISYTLRDGDALMAPLDADEIVGTATVTYDGKLAGTADVRTITAVERHKLLSAPTEEDSAIARLLPVIIIVAAVLLLLVAWANRRRGRRRKTKKKGR